jgi:hypothetical protein
MAFWIVAWSAYVSVEVWVLVHFVLNGPVAPLPDSHRRIHLRRGAQLRGVLSLSPPRPAPHAGTDPIAWTYIGTEKEIPKCPQ